MTITQKIKKLEAIKDLMERIEEREKDLKDSIEYYKKQIENENEEISEYDYRIKTIKENEDAIVASTWLKKEIEKLA